MVKNVSVFQQTLYSCMQDTSGVQKTLKRYHRKNKTKYLFNLQLLNMIIIKKEKKILDH